jgi:hypothetical protein
VKETERERIIQGVGDLSAAVFRVLHREAHIRNVLVLLEVSQYIRLLDVVRVMG